MAVDLLLGLQWGDEGKGKIVDVLTLDADWVVRYQGGNNAGHTGEIGNEKPGVLDKDGNIRDLSGHIDDVSGAILNETSLNKLREINF